MEGQTDTDARRFELFELQTDGRCMGFVEYYLFGNVAIVTHTEVTTGSEGKGRGANLVRHAIDYFRLEGIVVVPVCGFFAAQVRRNAHYALLLAPGCKRIFNL